MDFSGLFPNLGGDSNGIFGIPTQQQSQGAQPQRPDAQSGGLLSRPEIVEALGRMGAAVLEANAEGKGFNGAFGAGTQAFFDTKDKLAARANTQAQTGLFGAQSNAQTAQLKRLQLGLSNGDTPEGAAYNSRVIYHVGQGDDLATAQAKAYNEVGIKPQVTPGGAIIQPNAIPLPGADRKPAGIFGDAPASTLPGPNGEPSQVSGDTVTNGVLAPPVSGIFGTPNTIQQANATNKFGETTADKLAGNIQDQLVKAQIDYENNRQALAALTNAKNLIDQTFDTKGGAPSIKAKVNAFTGENADKVAATDAYQSNIQKVLGPMLRLNDTGPNGQFRVIQGEIQNNLNAIGDENKSQASRHAMIDPYIAQLDGGQRMAAERVKLLKSGQMPTPEWEQVTAKRLGIDPTTYLPVGKTSSDYLPGKFDRKAAIGRIKARLSQ